MTMSIPFHVHGWLAHQTLLDIFKLGGARQIAGRANLVQVGMWQNSAHGGACTHHGKDGIGRHTLMSNYHPHSMEMIRVSIFVFVFFYSHISVEEDSQ